MKPIFEKNLQFGDIWSRNCQKIAQIEVFGHFLDFASSVFFDFAHNDRWTWCLVIFLQFAGPVNVFFLRHTWSQSTRKELEKYLSRISSFYRSSRRRRSPKKAFWKFRNVYKKTPVLDSLCRPAILLKRDSNNVFLWKGQFFSGAINQAVFDQKSPKKIRKL